MPDHSHSMVPGGLLVKSSATRLTSGTSLVMRVEFQGSASPGAGPWVSSAGRPIPGCGASSKIGPDNDIPHVSASIIIKYVADLQLLGLLRPVEELPTETMDHHGALEL